jgi:SAM-dependent methyltransferase
MERGKSQMTEPGKTDHTAPEIHATLPEKRRVTAGSESRIGKWQAPIGVAPGTWDYVNRDHIGDKYDSFVSGEPLTEVDRKIISRYLPVLRPATSQPVENRAKAAPAVIDFGCGTGRTLVPILNDGYRGIAVDLSESMLRNLAKNISENELERASATAILANLVDLECLADDVADHGVCMLSTLGMIKGSNHRATFLNHVRRIIRRDGRFFVHAHNYFYQWRHPGGLRWAASNFWRAIRGREEVGDRLATYRNVSGMFIHQFRRSELTQALSAAGFTSLEWYGIDAGSTEPVPIKRWHNPFRFVGWVVVASS